MLTFTEELVLLLNDEDGAPLPIRRDIVACVLAGAVLMNLAFAYPIDTDLEALFVNERTPTGNPALDRILARIAARSEVCDTKTWIGVLSVEEAPSIHEQTMAGLVERGILTVRESRLPWIRSRRYPRVRNRGYPAARSVRAPTTSSLGNSGSHDMTTQALVLWGAGTMRTHRTLWLAEELGLDYEHRPIGPRTGETKTDEFLAINPRHKIPALVHGDICLTESAAIMTYMTETFPVPDHVHVPGDALGRARLLEWCFFTMSELDANAIYSVRRHGDLVEIYGASPIAVSAAIDYFDHQLECMEERIAGAGPFLMGAKISIADILFMSCLDAAEHYELALPDWLRDYRIRMRARPAYAETYPRNYGGRSAPEV